MSLTYSLSGWISNLGVVPLLLFPAFLFAPAFLFLSFLLILVIVVLDDIRISLKLISLLIFKYLNLAFLAKIRLFVKGLFFFSVLAGQAYPLSSENSEHLILSKGEQKEISTVAFQKFSLGNPEVIAVHSGKNAKKLLIKAKSIGFSDIVLWTKNGTKKIDVFVVRKSQYLKNVQSVQDFESLGLELKFRGKAVLVKGEINNLEDWNMFRKLKKQTKAVDEVSISLELKQKTIANLYEELIKEGVNWVDCILSSAELQCEYSGTKMQSFLEKKLKEKYPVTFYHNKKARHAQNFRLKFKIIQIEHYNQKSLNLGLNKVATTIRTLLQGTTTDVLGGNQTLFAGFNGHYELLSEPSQLITMGEKNLLEIGSEIPYMSNSFNGNDLTQWKFAGIKVKTLLNEKFQKYTLKYETELTRPTGKSISGSKESSLVYLSLSKYTEIFELNFKTNSIEDEYLPLIGQIPILKYLFSSNGKGETYKQIIGFVKLEKTL